MAVGDQGQRLGPGQRRPLALAVERRLAPGVEQIEPLLVLAGCAQLLGVHVDAMGAAVDLRRPQLHQLEQAMLKAAAVDEGMQFGNRLGGRGRGQAEIHPGFHASLPMSSDVAPMRALTARLVVWRIFLSANRSPLRMRSGTGFRRNMRYM